MRQAASIALVVLGLALPRSAPARPSSVTADAMRSSSTPTVYDPIASLALSPDGRTLVAAYELGTGRVWSVRSHALVRVEKFGGSADVFPSPDGRTVAVEDLDGVELWDVHAEPFARPAVSNAKRAKHLHDPQQRGLQPRRADASHLPK